MYDAQIIRKSSRDCFRYTLWVACCTWLGHKTIFDPRTKPRGQSGTGKLIGSVQVEFRPICRWCFFKHQIYIYLPTRNLLLSTLAAVAVIVVIGFVLSRFSAFETPIKEIAVVPFAGTDNAMRRGDVVFVHGLGDNARGAWQPEDSKMFWPNELHVDNNDLGIWGLDYDAEPSRWLGQTMPLGDRARHLLDEMLANDIGTKKPVIFVCHSLGGNVVKRMLQEALTENKPEWQKIAKNTNGVVFLATPHAGSGKAELFNWISYYLPGRASVTIQELQSNSAPLRDLNLWYRNNVTKMKVETRVFSEEYEMPELKGLGLIVDQSSSDPGINNVIPTPVPANHRTISKPSTKQHLVYKSVSSFIATYLKPAFEPDSTPLIQFLSDFQAARSSQLAVDAFKKERQRKLYTWEVYILV